MLQKYVLVSLLSNEILEYHQNQCCYYDTFGIFSSSSTIYRSYILLQFYAVGKMFYTKIFWIENLTLILNYCFIVSYNPKYSQTCV